MTIPAQSLMHAAALMVKFTDNDKSMGNTKEAT